jgi:hypothetical protein
MDESVRRAFHCNKSTHMTLKIAHLLNIDVSPGQISHACNTMNEPLHTLKTKGYTVRVGGDVTNEHIGTQALWGFGPLLIPLNAF